MHELSAYDLIFVWIMKLIILVTTRGLAPPKRGDVRNPWDVAIGKVDGCGV